MSVLPRNYHQIGDTLHFKKINIHHLAKKHGTSLRINFPDMLVENHDFLVRSVQDVLRKRSLPVDKFQCGYAIKANQNSNLVTKAARHTGFLEVSSANDLSIIEMVKDELGNKMVVCHGFKPAKTSYFKKMIELLKEGYNIIPVIDSLEELHDLELTGVTMKVGIRVNSKITFGDKTISDRFGVKREDIDSNIEHLIHHPTLDLTLLHIHISNTITDIDRRMEDMSEFFSIFESIQKAGKVVDYLSTGGGLPDRLHTTDTFYTEFYEKLLSKLQFTAGEDIPIILSESGRYLAAETQLLVMRVLLAKDSDQGHSWYVLDESAINMVPETMLDKDKHFEVIPVNQRNKPTSPAICTGSTCDQSDFFHLQVKKLPVLDPNDELFVVIPGTGAYQESLLGSARNMPGHCLIGGTKEVTISSNGMTIRETGDVFLENLGYSKMKKGVFSRLFSFLN